MNGLKKNHYKVVLADPASKFETFSDKGRGKCAEKHYPTMTLEEICALPIKDYLHPDGAILILWTTWPQAAKAYHIKVMESWGFAPSSGGVWAKVTKNALPAFGMGYVLRDACEPFFTGKYKKVPKGWKKTERNLILGPLREHSRKPPQMMEMIERCIGGPYLELFSRSKRDGWDSWGNETDKFTQQ